MSVTLALPALLLALLLTGCGSGGDAGAGGTKPNTRPDERLRQTISKGLVAAGRQEEARIVALSGSR
ncbi:hypothetical protein [Actinomadura madurae]|nr:hypothetical protein [Actinomadura madurae]SPT50405.1 Uncharacterised protein [Actinomadura madurae]